MRFTVEVNRWCYNDLPASVTAAAAPSPCRTIIWIIAITITAAAIAVPFIWTAVIPVIAAIAVTAVIVIIPAAARPVRVLPAAAPAPVKAFQKADHTCEHVYPSFVLRVILISIKCVDKRSDAGVETPAS